MADTDTVDIQQSSAIEQFQGITGAAQDAAKSILEACNWNLEMAINMHVDSIEPAARTAAASNAIAASSQTNGDPDEVRAPIPPVRQVLVEDDYNPSYRSRRATSSVFDAFRDFQAEASWQEEMQSSSSGVNGEDLTGSFRRNKRRTLQDMYRPPLDLLFRGSLEAAKDEGTKKNKWLLVNIQNVQEFPCQVLNRDVWSNVAVKDIVSEHFIFWQIYHDSSEGQRYCQFYNVNSFPHIAIVDPRTGEKMRHWTTLDAIVFCEQVTEFIGEHASPDGSIAGPAASSSRTPAVSGSKSRRIDAEGLYEQSEEDQLKAAIAASLRDVQSNTRMLDSEDDSDEDVVCLDTEDDESSNTIPAVLVTDEKWEDFVGLDSAKLSQLVIRFPDGSRQQKNFPSDSKLKALLLYVSFNGYDMKEYEVVTNYPRRNLSDLPSTETLVSVGLFPRETVFVQQKSTQ